MLVKYSSEYTYFYGLQSHGKDYGTTEEEMMRHTIWESNKKYIDTHNEHADTLGYTLAMNKFGDLVNFEHQLVLQPQMTDSMLNIYRMVLNLQKCIMDIAVALIVQLGSCLYQPCPLKIFQLLWTGGQKVM